MQIRELSIPHAWEFTPDIHRDERGRFLEFYRFEKLEEAVGHALDLKQGNISVSAAGVLRGVHYALVPPSQAKYATAVRGAFIDFIVDLRVGSPTFGNWDSVVIDDISCRAVYLAEGLGHAILSLTDDATVSYLVSEVFNPERELGINALDPALGLDLSSVKSPPSMAPKDLAAPTIGQALELGLLPSWQECLDVYASRE
ncbi:MAG: dTDP-4-dehydrorhamnose 3,5-epimerase family protein [Candidatus Saccharibacteria bacterium]|nr:dTDP-4-dehydrorhamnose 3,5-epimerase family protein [Microbacteriaceae bacterium]